MAEQKKKNVRRRPRPTNAVQFTVWNATGAPVPEDAIKSLEAAIEKVSLELFNDGQRLLTQTTRG